jgi:hypothetical protein
MEKKMKTTFRLLLTLLMSMFLTTAFADDGQKLSVTEKIEINAAPSAVWAAAKNFGDLHVWHPGIQSSTNTDGNNAGSVRVLDLGGPTITEELVRFNDEKMNFTYKINEVDPAVLPVENYISWFAVRDNGQGGSSVIWMGSFNLVGTPNPDDIKAGVSGVYRGGIENLKTTLEGAAE